MSNQHLRTEIVPPRVATAISELQEFIRMHSDSREVRKALALKLVYQGYAYEEIQTILDVSQGSDNWMETSL